MTGTQVLEPKQETEAGELFRAGNLSAAVTAQLACVKARPTDHGQRLFLFELLAFNGEYERASRQIGTINYGDPTLDVIIASYRRLLDAEQVRRDVFAGKAQPKFLSTTPEHTGLRLQAVAALAKGETAEATKLLSQATGQAPALSGQLNDQAFNLLVDCDDVFGTLLEVISATGAYFWVPLEQLATLEIEAPRYPRDLLWTHARLELVDGQQGDVFLPALYPNSSQSSDEQIRLGRQTNWQASEGGPTRGLGARMFLVDENAVSLTEWRSLQINH